MENKNSKVDKIIKELEQNLSKMTKEEREIFFKEMGFVFIEETPKERKQQLINLLTTLRAVLLQKQQEKHMTFEDAKAMIDFMKSKPKPKLTLKGKRHIPTENEIEAMQKANERIKEGNLRELEAKASTEKEGIVYCSLPDTTQATEEPKTGMEESDIVSANKIIEELDANLSKMSKTERENYFKKMGLVFEEKPTEKEERHHKLIRLK